MYNGHRTTITLAADPDISLWEIEVTPPGIDGGDPVDITTMHNDNFRTKYPRTLKDTTDATVVCAYDPNVITQLDSVLNVLTTITVTYPDGSTDAEFGYLRMWEPDALVEGEMPTGTATFTFCNIDPADDTEAVRTFTNVAGT